jgi:hypothetical protein
VKDLLEDEATPQMTYIGLCDALFV